MLKRHNYLGCVLFVGLLFILVSGIVPIPHASPVNAQGESFIIGAYGQPHLANFTSQQYDYMSDAHINVVQMNWGYGNSTESEILQALDWASQRGIKIQVSDIRQREYHPTVNPNVTFAQIDSIVDSVTNSFKNHSATLGYQAYDEPHDSTQINNAAHIYNRMILDHPGSINSYNLLPIYGYILGSYRQYIQQNIDAIGASNVDYLSYDFYPFLLGAGSIRDDYFNNLEIFTNVCKNNGIKNMLCYLQTSDWINLYRTPNENELRWNIYTNISYGMKGYFCFTWMVPDKSLEDYISNAPINYDGTKMAMYPIIQQLNGQVEKLGPTLMSLDTPQVYHEGIIPEGTMQVPENYFWTPTTSYDQIISHFIQNGTQRHYVMVVNRDFTNSRTLSFNIGAKPLGITEISKATGSSVPTNYDNLTGSLSSTFLPGEGKLYLLSDDFTLPPVIPVNSGFETGDLSGWSGYGTRSVVNNNQHGGSYCAKLEYVGGNTSSFDQEVNGLQPDTTYTLKAWVKVENSSGKVHLGVKDYSGPETSVFSQSTVYTQLTLNFTTGPADRSARIYLYRENVGTGAGYCDDIVLTCEPVNPGFETGSLDGWGGYGTRSVVNTNQHGGNYSAKLEYLGGNDSSAFEQVVTGLQPNTSYTLKAWAKVENSSARVYLGVRDYSGPETNISTQSTVYTQLTLNFTTGSNDTSAKIYLYRENVGTGAAYCDDVELVSIPFNSGFETGDLGGWSGYGIRSVVAANQHGGSYCVKLEYIGGNTSAVEQVINLLPNTTYMLKSWAKVDNASARVQLGVKDYSGPEVYVSTQSTAYNQLMVTFTTGSNDTSAKIYLYRENVGTGAAYCDDVVLIRTPVE